MKIHRHLIAATFLVGATLTFIAPSSAAVTVGGPAVFEEGIGNCGGDTVGFSTLVPESITADFSISDGTQCVGVVTVTPDPSVDVQISSKGFPIVATGRVTYQMGPVAIDPAAPTDIPLPVLFTILGSASATGFGGAVVQVLGVTEFPAFASACGASNPACVLSSNVSLNLIGTLEVLPGEFITVLKSASASSLSGEEGEGQAVIDPQFRIDPDFRVDFKGVSTLATDLYTLGYSQGIGAVPEPQSFVLMVAGLIIVVCALRRRTLTPALTTDHRSIAQAPL